MEEQERQGRQFAAEVGAEVVTVYLVPGHSRDIWRWSQAEAAIPAYRQLRQDIEAGRIDVLYCVESDRLGRDPALVQQVISLVERAGGEVYRASRPHVLGSKSIGDRYIDAFDAVSAGQEEAKRRIRHHMGMKGRIEKRGLLPGAIPFYLDAIREPNTGQVTGYRFNDQVGALDLITKLFLAGYSYAEIRRRLQDSPWPPPGRGQRWWHRTIQETMKSDIPAGIPSWGEYRAAEPSPAIPARWDPITHQAVIRERDRRAASGYHRRGAGPLSKVAVCGRCGGAMTRHQAERVIGYYLRCNRHAARSVYPHYACHPNHILESRAMAAVAEFLEWFSNENILEQALAGLGDSGQCEALKQELGQAQAAAAELERRKIRAGHAFAAGDMDITVYRSVDQELTARLAAEMTRIEKLTQTLEALPDLAERRALLQDLARSFPALLLAKDPPEIATLLQQAGIHVQIENGQVSRILLR